LRGFAGGGDPFPRGFKIRGVPEQTWISRVRFRDDPGGRWRGRFATEDRHEDEKENEGGK
jgi:hypothetical protein